MTNIELEKRINQVRFLLRKYKLVLEKITDPSHTILSTHGVALIAEEIQRREVELYGLLELQKRRKEDAKNRNGEASNRNVCESPTSRGQV